MSRMYEALKKAESAQRAASRPPIVTAVNGRHAPNIQWDVEGDAQLECERIRVWVTTPVQGSLLRTVAVVGCRAGSGATTTAALMSASLASGKRSRVLLVDANFRTSSLDLVFNVKNTHGLTEVLCDDTPPDDCVQPTGRDNLAVLTTGRISPYPVAVFDQEALHRFLERVTSAFDFVVFDTAPVLESPATCALASAVDGVLLVLHADRTSVDDARTARRQLERANARVIGAVLNRCQDHTPPLIRRWLSRSQQG